MVKKDVVSSRLDVRTTDKIDFLTFSSVGSMHLIQMHSKYFVTMRWLLRSVVGQRESV